jgi:hypothetical protein
MSTSQPPIASNAADWAPMSRALPLKESRWGPRRKAAVVAAVRDGTLTLAEACDRYRLSEAEFASWQDAIDQEGVAGLSSKRLAERRRHVRTPVTERGIALLDGSTKLECTLRDLSQHGARLEFSAPVRVPKAFQLRCVDREHSSWVDLIWQHDRQAGVRFEVPLQTLKIGS